jgi:hypothetical protein
LPSAAYYFAAFTGRDIIISDNSIIGEMCHVINCGFPFVSDLALAFPEQLTVENVRYAEELKVLTHSVACLHMHAASL